MRKQTDTTPEGAICPEPISRRAFVAGAAITTLAASALGQSRDYQQNSAPVRYPDKDILVLDKRFGKYKIGNTSIQRLHTGMLWAEGPAWNGVGRYLMWSDIPNDVQMRWLDEDGHVSVMRRPAGNSNGNTFDYEGRQISCEHGTRKVVRYEYDGSVTVLADQYQGKPLNAPNDVIVHPDGGIWFTDPGYGIMGNYEGRKQKSELKEAVYRIDPASGKMALVTDALAKPNGLCFSPDYQKLYIVDTGVTHNPDHPREIAVWDVVDGQHLRHGRTFASMVFEGMQGMSDGIRADSA